MHQTKGRLNKSNIIANSIQTKRQLHIKLTSQLKTKLYLHFEEKKHKKWFKKSQKISNSN